MIGTTRSRVSFFMNRFKNMGLIHYDGGLHVHSSLLNIVLRRLGAHFPVESSRRTSWK